MATEQSLRKIFDASNQKTAHFDLYKTELSGATIRMSLFPGTTGQAALTDIQLEGSNPDKSRVGAIEHYELGLDTDLNNRFLDVYTVITDTSKDTDDTSLDFRLEGGIVPYEYFMKKTVQTEGDSVVYKVSIFFTGK